MSRSIFYYHPRCAITMPDSHLEPANIASYKWQIPPWIIINKNNFPLKRENGNFCIIFTSILVWLYSRTSRKHLNWPWNSKDIDLLIKDFSQIKMKHATWHCILISLRRKLLNYNSSYKVIPGWRLSYTNKV